MYLKKKDFKYYFLCNVIFSFNFVNFVKGNEKRMFNLFLKQVLYNE